MVRGTTAAGIWVAFFPTVPALIVCETQVAGVLSTAIYPLGFSVLRERSGGYDAPLMLCAGFSVVLAGAILCCFRKPSRPRRDM